MRFLLTALNAKYIHSNPALYSLKSYVGSLKDHVQIAEYTINNRIEFILEDIYSRKPDAIGFSCYIWNWNMIREILRELPKIMPGLPIWLGGPEVSFDGAEILREFPMVTGIMVGEGEETFREVLLHYLRGESDDVLSTVPGLLLKTGPTGKREALSMEKVPFLYEDMAPFENRIIYYESQRGCPFRCSYCLSSIDKSVRFRNPDTVKRELQFFLDKKVKQVKFVDRTFNCNHEHAMAIWQYISEHDNGVTNFHFEIAADIIREEEIAILRKLRPGLVQMEIGVQSTNEKTLAEIRRNMDVSRLKQVVSRIKEGQNIHVHLDLIAGLPYEDYESFRESFNEVYTMGPEQLQLGFLKVLKGSYMHEKAKDYGLVYLENPPYEVLYTNWISYEDIRRLKKIEEMVEIYYNSNQFRATLPYLLKQFPSPFALYEALADYYEEKGFFVETPARIYRYQVLLSFAEQVDGAHKEVYMELLLYDLYSRENLKSRPDFAPDQNQYRQMFTQIYRREAEERQLLPTLSAYDSRQLAHMTHMEVFRYSVWEQEVTLMSEKKIVLFDYENRNPLTYDARVVVLENDL
ncbi:MAG: B12-binding domain-containing radical SAM protein [Lachnospiraceae bacterium]